MSRAHVEERRGGQGGTGNRAGPLTAVASGVGTRLCPRARLARQDGAQLVDDGRVLGEARAVRGRAVPWGPRLQNGAVTVSSGAGQGDTRG